MCEFWSKGLRFFHRIQLLRGGLHRPYPGTRRSSGRSRSPRISDGWLQYPGSMKPQGRLGVVCRHQPLRLPSLPTSALARPVSRHDVRPLRRPLGHGRKPGGTWSRRITSICALPGAAAPRFAGGRRSLPRPRRRTERLSSARVGHPQRLPGPARLQLRRLCCGGVDRPGVGDAMAGSCFRTA